MSYTVTGLNTYALTVVRNASTSDATGISGPQQTFTFTGTDAGTPLTYDVAQVHLFNANGISDDNHNFYFNSLSITNAPEPSSLALAVSGSVLALARRRRKTVIAVS